MRIDLWLFHARLFKSRSKATAACKEGKILRAGKRLEPSDDVKAHDVIEVREHGLYRSIRILELPAKNISKEAARTTYRDETATEIVEQFRLMAQAQQSRPYRDSKSKPTKKERRAIEVVRGRK